MDLMKLIDAKHIAMNLHHSLTEADALFNHAPEECKRRVKHARDKLQQLIEAMDELK